MDSKLKIQGKFDPQPKIVACWPSLRKTTKSLVFKVFSKTAILNIPIIFVYLYSHLFFSDQQFLRSFTMSTMNNRHILTAAIGGLLALGLVSNASAADKKMEMEKCFGVAKAGMNDCSSNKSAHS